MKYTIIALDPGLSGGIAIITDNDEVFAIKTPLKDDEIDVFAIREFLDLHVATNKPIQVWIEDVHSVFNSSAKSNFEFGRALGVIQGMIKALGLKIEKVQPKKWQKQMFIGVNLIQKEVKGKLKTDTKAMALEAVRKLYPNVNLLPTKRCKKPSDGIVDAILIAEYGRLNFINSMNGK